MRFFSEKTKTNISLQRLAILIAIETLRVEKKLYRLSLIIFLSFSLIIISFVIYVHTRVYLDASETRKDEIALGMYLLSGIVFAFNIGGLLSDISNIKRLFIEKVMQDAEVRHQEVIKKQIKLN